MTYASKRRLNMKKPGRVGHSEHHSAAVRFVFVASELGQAGDGASTE